MNEWIDVNDRLPPKSKDTKYRIKSVMVIFYNHKPWNDSYLPVTIGFYDFDEEVWRETNYEIVNASHWMKLPEPPDTVSETGDNNE